MDTTGTQNPADCLTCQREHQPRERISNCLRCGSTGVMHHDMMCVTHTNHLSLNDITALNVYYDGMHK